jgi:putative ABC transport system permease protein
MVLLIGAGLMVKSLWRLSNVDRGFESAGVLTTKIDPSEDRYKEFNQVVAFYGRLLEHVSAIPGVRHAGIINSWDHDWRVAVEGGPPVPEEQRPLASQHPVSADYFRAMGIPLRSGRFFNDRDVKGALPVAIIDETLARRHFPDENPIGKHLRFQDALREIVGVVGATRAWKLYSFDSDEEFPRVYLPYQQENWSSMSLIVRSQSGDTASLIPVIRRELAQIDKDQPIHSFKLLERSVAELSDDRRFSTTLLSAFAALAALLSAVGIYGVMSYTVTQRTREIGVRMALGAQRRDILKLVVGHGLALILTGAAAGLVGAFALTHYIETLLFDVAPTDMFTYIVVSLSLAVVAVLACYLPARRATKVEPMIALRYE